MRCFPFRATAQRQLCFGLKPPTTSWPVLPLSISASSMPVSAVAAAWHGTTNNKNNKIERDSARVTRATRVSKNGENKKKKKKNTPTKGGPRSSAEALKKHLDTLEKRNKDTTQCLNESLPQALEEHLDILAKGGLENKIIKLLKDAAGQEETSTFDAIVEAAHAAVKNKTSETDVDGPDMSLATFRELVACGADAPAVQRVLVTLNYNQREHLELDMRVQMKQDQHLSKFPKNCRDWLYVALMWDGELNDAAAAPPPKHSTPEQHDDAQPDSAERTRASQPEHPTKHSSRTLRYHAAAVALQILRDEHHCLPLRPGSVTHFTSTLSQVTYHSMLGQSSYVHDFSKELLDTFEPGTTGDKLPFMTNYSTPRAGKSTVLRNGLRTAQLEFLNELLATTRGQDRCAFVVVAATVNNDTSLIKSHELKRGTTKEAFFAMDWRFVHSLLRPVLSRSDLKKIATDLDDVAKAIVRAALSNKQKSGAVWCMTFFELISQKRLGMKTPPTVRCVFCIDEFTSLVDALRAKVLCQNGNWEETQMQFGTKLSAVYITDNYRLLLSGFTTASESIVSYSGRLCRRINLDVMHDIELLPGKQYGAFVQRILVFLHNDFTNKHIIKWFEQTTDSLLDGTSELSQLASALLQHCTTMDKTLDKALKGSDGDLDRKHFMELASLAVEKYRAAAVGHRLESVRRVFRGRYLPAKYVYKQFPHKLFTMLRFQPGLLGHFLDTEKSFQELRESVPSSLNLNFVRVGLIPHFKEIADIILTAVCDSVHSQKGSINLETHCRDAMTHWILVPIERDVGGTKKKTCILQPFTILYIFGHDDVMKELTPPTTPVTHRDLLFLYIRAIARLVLSSTIPASMLFEDIKVMRGDQTPFIMESVVFLCFAMQLSLNNNAIPRVANVVCDSMCDDSTMASYSPSVQKTVKVHGAEFAAALKKNTPENDFDVKKRDVLGMKGQDYVVELSLKSDICMGGGPGMTLADTVNVLQRLEDANAPPVVLCSDGQPAIDLVVLASLHHSGNDDHTSVKELWCVSVKLRASDRRRTTEDKVDRECDSLVHALAFDWLRVALQAQAEVMKNVRFVAVSAARICEKEIVNAIKAVSCAPPFATKPAKDSPFHTQYQIKQMIEARPRPTQELSDFLDELEATCPISTGLTGFGGLDVLMPAGLAALLPTVNVRSSPISEGNQMIERVPEKGN
eukprot:PhM_4_TR14668/c2_g1_i2/m.35544